MISLQQQCLAVPSLVKQWKGRPKTVKATVIASSEERCNRLADMIHLIVDPKFVKVEKLVYPDQCFPSDLRGGTRLLLVIDSEVHEKFMKNCFNSVSRSLEQVANSYAVNTAELVTEITLFSSSPNLEGAANVQLP